MSTQSAISKLAAAAVIMCPVAVAHAGGFVAPQPDPVIVAPIQEEVSNGWEGAYVGAALGYAMNGDDRVGVFNRDAGQSDFAFQGDIGTLRPKGPFLALRGGYRWERNKWVIGPELEVHGGNIDDEVSRDFSDDGVTAMASAKIKEKYAVSLRMKTGYQLRPDTIVYGIAGIAHGKFDYDLAETGTDDDGRYAIGLGSGFSSTGYVVGLGAERKLNERLSLTGDVEYYNYGKTEITWTDAEGDSVQTNATPDYWALKLGLNYQF
ncbi:outer membrane protein [Paracoccus jiaweipingae]|uniref:outer membrane protein n=1 Tax=unclassified Paracoccus (in: a-proteobacteria) TaxID=2688777 RepID=UPI00378D6E4C